MSDEYFTGQCLTCFQDCSCQAEENASMYFGVLGDLNRIKKALAPTEENVAALAREIERLFGYKVGTVWRARQALEALNSLLSRTSRAPMPVESLLPGDVRHNGGVRCDMAVGPCACGATHTRQETSL